MKFSKMLKLQQDRGNLAASDCCDRKLKEWNEFVTFLCIEVLFTVKAWSSTWQLHAESFENTKRAPVYIMGHSKTLVNEWIVQQWMNYVVSNVRLRSCRIHGASAVENISRGGARFLINLCLVGLPSLGVDDYVLYQAKGHDFPNKSKSVHKSFTEPVHGFLSVHLAIFISKMSKNGVVRFSNEKAFVQLQICTFCNFTRTKKISKDRMFPLIFFRFLGCSAL